MNKILNASNNSGSLSREHELVTKELDEQKLKLENEKKARKEAILNKKLQEVTALRNQINQTIIPSTSK
jgi:hypothetical protein